MRAHWRWSLLPILTAACIGCSPSPTPLPAAPVEGTARDLRWLAGDWVGEFASSRADRRGTIAFSLRAGRDTAEGRVVFTGPTPPPGCTDPVSAATGPRAEAEIVLTFARVDVSDRAVAGWMRPYRDPELGCLMDAWFEGEERGDTLAGMYFSHPADVAASVRLGTWWVARRR
ncbi:MAG TPA: hypothetical protein VH700_17760 [Gemmatimonadales bacterium]